MNQVSESTVLGSGFKYGKTQSNVTCSRTFLYDENALPGSITIPKIGSIFSAPTDLANPTDASGLPIIPNSASRLYCRSQDVELVAGDPTKLTIVCNYSNEPVDTNIFISKKEDFSAPQDPEYLPKTCEYAGEMVSINPSSMGSSNWKWTSTGNTVQQPIPSRVPTTSVRVTKYTISDYYQQMQAHIAECAGTVNNYANPLGASMGGGAGCWLFVGASAEQFVNAYNLLFWKIDLEFNYRNPDGTSTVDGYQKILSLDHGWDIPVDGSNNKLYRETDFYKLFNELY